MSVRNNMPESLESIGQLRVELARYKRRELARQRDGFGPYYFWFMVGLMGGGILGRYSGERSSRPVHAYFANDSQAQNGDINGDGYGPDLVIFNGRKLIPLYANPEGTKGYYESADSSIAGPSFLQRVNPTIDYDTLERKLNTKE